MKSARNSIPTSQISRWWCAVLVLVAVLFIFPDPCAAAPPIYSAKNSSITGLHQDLTATGDLTRTDVALILQEWTTSLNLTGQIVRNIDLGYFESAENTLREYQTSGRNLKALVVRLDMIDTDVARFQADNLVNAASLRALLEQTREFDKLVDAEATFLAQKNSSGLKSVELHGKALCTKIRRNYNDYADRSDRVISVSRMFGVDTSAFEGSVVDFAEIVANMDTVQKKRSSLIHEALQEILDGEVAVNLEIHPDHGVYGDTLLMAGTVQAPEGTTVTLFVDGRASGRSTVNDQIGRFSFPYSIEKIGAHTHTAYASVNSAISEVSTFKVDTRNTTISLAAHVVEENGTVKGIGSGRLVTEGGIPVRSARIYLDVDGRSSWGEGLTGNDGSFTVVAEQLSPGTHTLQARFDPDEVPLNGSESAPVTVNAPSRLNWINAIVYLFGIGGAAVGAVLYLRPWQKKDARSWGSTAEVSPLYSVEPTPIPTIEEAHQIADRLVITNKGRVDRHETISEIYRKLVRELENRNPDLRLRWRTPRDLAALFADQPYGDQLALLVGIHEKVRYANQESTEEELERIREAFISIISDGGRH